MAVDIDPVAVADTETNMKRNDTPDIDVFVGTAESVQQSYPLVVANILLGPIIREAEHISRCVLPAGTLLLTGLLMHQEEEVVARYRNLGFQHIETRSDDIWILIELERPRG